MSYSADVKPILEAKCIIVITPTIHQGRPDESVRPRVGILDRMSTWESTSSPLIVEPGHPERSFLVEKIIGTDLLDHEGSPHAVDHPAAH